MKGNYKPLWVFYIGILLFHISVTQIKAQAIDTIYSTDEIFAMEVLRYNPGNILLAATFSCVSKSTDYGVTWTTSNFDTLIGCSDISFNTENSNIGLLATGVALSKTTDGGTNWFYTNQLDYTFFVNINPYFPDIIFVWGAEDPLLGPFHFYRSLDSGVTWLDSLGDLRVFEPQFHPDNSNVAYAHKSTKILKTTDTGETWSVIWGSGNNLMIEAIRIYPNNPDVLYFGGDGIFYKTTDGGLQWNGIDSALKVIEPDYHISCLLVDEDIYGRLYIGLRNLGNTKTGLYLTEDDGKSWKQIYNEAIFDIEADSESPRNIYCVADDNYKNIAIRLLDTFHVTGINEVKDIQPDGYYLYQNYPNPFNSSTKIKFEIPGQARNDIAFVILKVYDILGREVATLVKEEKPTGEYEVEFNASKIPGGVYFYQLKAGSFIQTKKMILLK